MCVGAKDIISLVFLLLLLYDLSFGWRVKLLLLLLLLALLATSLVLLVTVWLGSIRLIDRVIPHRQH